MRNNVEKSAKDKSFRRIANRVIILQHILRGFLTFFEVLLSFPFIPQNFEFWKKKKKERSNLRSFHSFSFSFFLSFGKIRYEEAQRGISQDLERRLHSEQKSAEAVPRGKYEAEMDRVRNILQHNLRKERNCEKLEKLPKATQTNLPPPLSAISQSSVPKPMSVRQDSNVSSDSFSQTSSPSYTSKTMEAPLLPHKYSKVPGKEREVKYKILLMK